MIDWEHDTVDKHENKQLPVLDIQQKEVVDSLNHIDWMSHFQCMINCETPDLKPHD